MTLPTVGEPAGEVGRPPAKKPEEKKSPEQSEIRLSPLSIALPELISTARTPEKRAEKVTLSQSGYDTLVNTISFHFEIIENMAAKPVNTTLPGLFYETFKNKYPGVDFKDPKKIDEYAKKFIDEGGGVEVRLALKLAEWEAEALQAATGRQFKKVGAVTKLEVEGTTYVLGPDGLKVGRPAGWLRTWLEGIEVETQRRYKIEGGNRIDIVPATNTLINALQQQYLEKCGWTSGYLSSQQIAEIDQRLFSVASVRSELYLKTGLKQADIELNFIKKALVGGYGGRKYRDTKTAHFIGEGGAGANVRDILEAEGVAITTEVKTKVQKEIDKRKEEARARKTYEGTVAQLDHRIEEIRKKYELTQVERDGKVKVIQAEKKRLEEEYKLFGRQTALPAEIAVATAARDEAERKVTTHQATVAIPQGETSVDLLAWSSGSSNPESWEAIQKQCEALKGIRTDILAQKDDRLAEKNELQRNQPTIQKTIRTTIDPSTGKVTGTQEEAIQSTLDRYDEWSAKIRALEAEIVALRDSIEKDAYSGGSPLKDQIKALEQKYLNRKRIVEDDPAVKQLLTDLAAAEKEVTQKTDENASVSAKIAALPAGEQSEAEIKVKIEAEEKKEKGVGEPIGEDMLEIEALTALKAVMISQNHMDCNNRIAEVERGERPTLDYGPKWKDFPDIVKRCVEMIWGENLLQAHPVDKDLGEQVLRLMGSKNYLDVFISAIETAQGIITDNAVVATACTAGSYDSISAVFPAAAAINAVTIDKIDIKLIDKITEELRKKALQISSTP